MELSPSPLVTTPDSIISRRVLNSLFFFCRSTMTEFKNSTWPRAASLSSVTLEVAWLPTTKEFKNVLEIIHSWSSWRISYIEMHIQRITNELNPEEIIAEKFKIETQISIPYKNKNMYSRFQMWQNLILYMRKSMFTMPVVYQISQYLEGLEHLHANVPRPRREWGDIFFFQIRSLLSQKLIPIKS